MSTSVFALLATLLYTQTLSQRPCYRPEQLTVVSWNVDSLHTDPHLAALQISQMDGVDLWGLCGVRSERWPRLFEQAAEEGEERQFVAVPSPTPGTDSSLILYDAAALSLLRYFEAGWRDERWYRPGMVLRPALIAQFRHSGTGQEFLFILNCLHPKWSAWQAMTITEWAARQGLPVVAAGTHQFQYDLGDSSLEHFGRVGSAVMLTSGVFRRLRPEEVVRTHGNRYNTVEDFIFLADPAGRIRGRAEIPHAVGDFAVEEATLAHHPVKAVLTFVPARGGSANAARVLRKIRRIQVELDKLEESVRQLPELTSR